MTRIISPSILSADFGHLYDTVQTLNASRAEWIHFDVMDGVFVPNISFGFPVLKAVRKATDKLLDVHLMIVEPHRYVSRFAEAGADLITVHAEAEKELAATLRLIRSCGARAGVSISPATPVETIEQVLPLADLALVMSVEPGFGGQSFIPGSLDKIRRLRQRIDSLGLECLIEADGGISAANIREVFEAGCDVAVAGSAVFSADPVSEIEKLLNA